MRDSESTSLTPETIHYYAGWPGKALCEGATLPVSPITSIRADHVTCAACKKLLNDEPKSPVTSNPRVSDADVIRDLKLCAEERAWPVFDLAIATIERLTRQRDHWKAEAVKWEGDERKRQTERDRLRHERNAAHRKADRLLTALKSIRDLRYSAFRTYQQNTEDMRAIASRALALPSEPNSAPETCELRMADGTPLYDYLRNAVPESTPMDDWTRGFEECKRRLFDIVGPQLRPPLKANDPSSINEAK